MQDGKNEKRNKILGTVMILICILITIYILWVLLTSVFPGLFDVLKSGDKAQIEAYIKQEGEWKGLISIVLLCILQVISVILPGWAIQMASGAIYPWFEAFIVCFVSFVFANYLVFIVIRKLGSNIESIVKTGKRTDWLTDKLNTANPTLVVLLAGLIPGVPNGIMPYLAARTNISKRNFLLAVASAAWMQILLNCIAGHFLATGEYLFTVLSILVQICILFLVYYYRDKILTMFDRPRKHTKRLSSSTDTSPLSDSTEGNSENLSKK
jgi:uncharacterized membrane protein YdjX (TVP38/TMEM64 family)